MDHITSNLGETSATTCFKGGKTNSPEELNTFLRSDGLRKMSQQLNTLLADAIVRFRLILETILWRSYDSLVKTARSRVRLHPFYAQKPVQIHQTYFPPPLFSARALYVRAQIRLARETTPLGHPAHPWCPLLSWPRCLLTSLSGDSGGQPQTRVTVFFCFSVFLCLFMLLCLFSNLLLIDKKIK